MDSGILCVLKMNGCGFFKNIKVSVFALPLCLTLCVKQSKVKKSIFISYLIKHLEVKMFYLYLFKYITYIRVCTLYRKYCNAKSVFFNGNFLLLIFQF